MLVADRPTRTTNAKHGDGKHGGGHYVRGGLEHFPLDPTLLKHLDKYGPADRLATSQYRNYLLPAWYDVYWRAFRDEREATKGFDRKALGWVMAVATDKIQLLHGQPTQINANLVAVRHDLGGLVGKLVAVAQLAGLDATANQRALASSMPLTMAHDMHGGVMGSHPGEVGVGMESSAYPPPPQITGEAPFQPPKRKRGRPRKYPLPATVVLPSTQA